MPSFPNTSVTRKRKREPDSDSSRNVQQCVQHPTGWETYDFRSPPNQQRFPPPYRSNFHPRWHAAQLAYRQWNGGRNQSYPSQHSAQHAHWQPDDNFFPDQYFNPYPNYNNDNYGPENKEEYCEEGANSAEPAATGAAGTLVCLRTEKAMEFCSSWDRYGHKNRELGGIIAVPLTELLNPDLCGHPKSSRFPCKEGCSLAKFAQANIPPSLLEEGRSTVSDMKITGFMLCRLFDRLTNDQIDALKPFEETHSAICGVEIPSELGIKKGYKHTDLCFTGFGHGYYRDDAGNIVRLDMTQFELACMETKEEAGLDVKAELKADRLEVFNWKNSDEVHDDWGTGDPIDLDQGNKERGLRQKKYKRRIWILLEKS